MNKYQEHGYFVIKQFIAGDELRELRELLLDFHESWKRKYTQFYASRAVNSAYVTGTEHLPEFKRVQLFRFIGSAKLMQVVTAVMRHPPAFMNTQLFFNPANTAQNNYWHRDMQYHLSPMEQEMALAGPELIHFRIPLFNEPGIELVPGSHTRWDTDEELAVRLERDGHNNHESLSSGVTVELEAGDLLVFSAAMIHRGLYGLDRLSLDVLFCDAEPSLLQFVDNDCLPDSDIIATLENPNAFLKTIDIKQR